MLHKRNYSVALCSWISMRMNSPARFSQSSMPGSPSCWRWQVWREGGIVKYFHTTAYFLYLTLLFLHYPEGRGFSILLSYFYNPCSLDWEIGWICGRAKMQTLARRPPGGPPCLWHPPLAFCWRLVRLAGSAWRPANRTRPRSASPVGTPLLKCASKKRMANTEQKGLWSPQSRKMYCI